MCFSRRFYEAHWTTACFTLVLLLLLSLPAAAQQTNNYVLRAVPAPGQVAIDGSLAEWDLSGKDFYGHRLTDLMNPQHPQRAFYWANQKAWGTARLVAEGSKFSAGERRCNGELQSIGRSTTRC